VRGELSRRVPNPMPIAGIPESIVRDFTASQASFKRAIELLEPLVAANPQVAEFRFTLALCYRDGSPPWRLRSNAGQENDLQKQAVDILERLVAESPNVPDYRLELAETIARVPPPDRITSEGLERTEADLRRALGIVEGLLTDSGQVPRYRQSTARILERLAGVEWMRRGPEPATASMRRAWNLYSGLADGQPTVPEYGLTALRVGIQFGDLLAWQEEWIESGRVFQECERRVETIAPEEFGEWGWNETQQRIANGLARATEALLRTPPNNSFRQGPDGPPGPRPPGPRPPGGPPRNRG